MRVKFLTGDHMVEGNKFSKTLKFTRESSIRACLMEKENIFGKIDHNSRAILKMEPEKV